MKLTLSSRAVGISLYILLPVMAICSVAELALKNSAPWKPADWPTSDRDHYWPNNVFADEQSLTNASAAVALVLSIVSFPLVIHAMRRGPIGANKIRLLVLTVLGFNLALALAAFLYSFITTGLSSRFDGDYYERRLSRGNFLYEKGRFTAEAWMCSIVDHYKAASPYENEGWYRKGCGMHNAARWLSFVVFVLAGGVLGIVVTDSRQEGHILHSV